LSPSPDVDEINNCCYAHDTCYDQQAGRHNCDNTFCNCLLIVTTGKSEICERENAPQFCTLVKEFGEGAYESAARTTALPVEAVTTVAGRSGVRPTRPGRVAG